MDEIAAQVSGHESKSYSQDWLGTDRAAEQGTRKTSLRTGLPSPAVLVRQKRSSYVPESPWTAEKMPSLTLHKTYLSKVLNSDGPWANQTQPYWIRYCNWRQASLCKDTSDWSPGRELVASMPGNSKQARRARTFVTQSFKTNPSFNPVVNSKPYGSKLKTCFSTCLFRPTNLVFILAESYFCQCRPRAGYAAVGVLAPASKVVGLIISQVYLHEGCAFASFASAKAVGTSFAHLLR